MYDTPTIDPFAILALVAVWGLVGVGLLVWYLWAMARLFPRIGLKKRDGWIPIWNQWQLLERAGMPGWTILLSFVGLGVIPTVMLIIAMHRINREAGAGAGYTVLGVFIPPLWATLLANFIGARTVAPAGGAPGQTSYASPQQGFAPPAPAAPAAPAGFAPPAGFNPQGGFAPPAPAAAPAEQRFAPPVPQQGFAPPAGQPGFAPPAPAAQQSVFAPPAQPAPAQPAQQPWASPSAPAAPAAPPAPSNAPLGSDTEDEYARLAAESFQAPPAVPLGRQAETSGFQWPESSQSQPAQPQQPRHEEPAAAAAPQPAPAAEPSIFSSQSQPEPEQRPVREQSAPVLPPVHPLAAGSAGAAGSDDADGGPAAPTAPQAAPAPSAPAAPPAPPAPPAPAAPAAPPAPEPAHFTSSSDPVDPDIVEGGPTPASAARKATGITGRIEPLPAHAAEEPEDLDRTIVVPRKTAPVWVLELPDGTELPLESDVIVGRRPEARDGAAALAIPDTTRTLSKSHVRLRLEGEQWTVEDLGSTNGLVLMKDDGGETELPAGVRAEATERMLFGTLEVRLRRGGDAA